MLAGLRLPVLMPSATASASLVRASSSSSSSSSTGLRRPLLLTPLAALSSLSSSSSQRSRPRLLPWRAAFPAGHTSSSSSSLSSASSSSSSSSLSCSLPPLPFQPVRTVKTRGPPKASKRTVVAPPAWTRSVKSTRVDRDIYDLPTAIRLVRAMQVQSSATLMVDMVLNVDPRKPAQMVRGVASLPYSTGKSIRVAVFARGDRANEARQAGADIVGDQDLADKILAGEIEFERCIATPDMMSVVSKVARVLGPKQLMPNPKTGTVTHAVGAAVRAAKKGQVEFKNNKAGVIRNSIAKISLPLNELEANASGFIRAVLDAKPPSIKGTFVKRVLVAGTLSKPIQLDLTLPPFKGHQTA